MMTSIVSPSTPHSFGRRLFTVACSIFALASTPVLADPSLFPQHEVCDNPVETPPSVAVPDRMIRWLLITATVSDAALDANADADTLADEKLLALTRSDYCSSIAQRCTPDDEKALAEAQDSLRSFAKIGGGPGYVIERLRAPSPSERRAALHLEDVPPASNEVELGELLDRGGRFFRIHCVALPEPPAATEAVKGDYWRHSAKKGGGFRLTGDIDDLSKSREKIGAVRAAEFSITSDLIEDETAYKINGVAGYAFEIEGGDEVQTSFIPFIEIERITSSSDNQVDTLGAGFQQAAWVNWPGPLKSEFAVTPVYTTDSDLSSHTGQVKFRWTPALANNPILPLGFPQVYGPVELRFGLDLLADAGRVFDDGGQGNLDGEGDFLRLGTRVGMQIRGAPGNLFRQFEIQLADRYLYNVDTTFESINQFDAAIAYLFPGNENYQLSFAYSNGRDENSLELFEFWQSQFGIRF
ncbi:MAG: hypothetical protein ACR2Q4_07200 [Geminicoccaceae bacterium]